MYDVELGSERQRKRAWYLLSDMFFPARLWDSRLLKRALYILLRYLGSVPVFLWPFSLHTGCYVEWPGSQYC